MIAYYILRWYFNTNILFQNCFYFDKENDVLLLSVVD